jgi:hypothetical protein
MAIVFLRAMIQSRDAALIRSARDGDVEVADRG